MAAVNAFYRWQVRAGVVAANPMPQRARRRAPVWVPGAGGDAVPATYSHDRAGERVEWFPLASYRLWRDVGVRGRR